MTDWEKVKRFTYRDHGKGLNFAALDWIRENRANRCIEFDGDDDKWYWLFTADNELKSSLGKPDNFDSTPSLSWGDFLDCAVIIGYEKVAKMPELEFGDMIKRIDNYRVHMGRTEQIKFWQDRTSVEEIWRLVDSEDEDIMIYKRIWKR